MAVIDDSIQELVIESTLDSNVLDQAERIYEVRCAMESLELPDDINFDFHLEVRGKFSWNFYDEQNVEVCSYIENQEDFFKILENFDSEQSCDQPCCLHLHLYDSVDAKVIGCLRDVFQHYTWLSSLQIFIDDSVESFENDIKRILPLVTGVTRSFEKFGLSIPRHPTDYQILAQVYSSLPRSVSSIGLHVQHAFEVNSASWAQMLLKLCCTLIHNSSASALTEVFVKYGDFVLPSTQLSKQTNFEELMQDMLAKLPTSLEKILLPRFCDTITKVIVDSLTNKIIMRKMTNLVLVDFQERRVKKSATRVADPKVDKRIEELDAYLMTNFLLLRLAFLAKRRKLKKAGEQTALQAAFSASVEDSTEDQYLKMDMLPHEIVSAVLLNDAIADRILEAN